MVKVWVKRTSNAIEHPEADSFKVNAGFLSVVDSGGHLVAVYNTDEWRNAIKIEG